MINVPLMIAVVACGAGIANFSYDAAMINSLNILQSFQTYFSLNSKWTGLIVAIINIGSISAVPLSGPVMDKYGRRKGMMLGSAIALVGAVLQASAHSIAQLLVGRFLIGASFIFTAAGSAPWLMEIASPSQRRIITNSMLGSLPIVGVCGGIVFLYIWDYDSEWSWRGGLMGEIVGPLVSLVALIFAPESIRYLVSKNRMEEAFDVLVKLRGTSADDVDTLTEFNQIKNTLRHEHEVESSNAWEPLFKPASNFRRFSIAVLTQIFFQTNGSNFMQQVPNRSSVAFFSLVLVSSGVTDMKLLLKVSIGNSAWAACATIAGIYLIEKVGARPMMLWSTPVLCVGFILMAILQSRAEATGQAGFGMGAVAVCFLFQAASFSSWILLAFSFPSEILKYSQRARGIAVSQAIGYLFAAMMAFTIPLAIEHIPWKFFIICAAWVAPMFPIIWWLFPDTQGRTLEEVDALFEGSAAEEWLHTGEPIEGKPESIDEKFTSEKSECTAFA
ncbi:general substrate transporter [Ilyonectria destructans]|nr:general substrate transporter [Ilyonectria destructans]